MKKLTMALVFGALVVVAVVVGRGYRTIDASPMETSSNLLLPLYNSNASGGPMRQAAAKPSETPTPSDSVLFQDDFESTPPGQWDSNWSDIRGTWTVTNSVNGSNVLSPISDTVDSRVSAGNRKWQDYSVQADVKPRSVAGNKSVSLLGRYASGSSYYYLTLSSGSRWQLGMASGGTRSILAEGTLGYGPGRFYTLKLRFSGQTINAYMNDVLIGQASDNSISAGRIALETLGGAEFDNVLVFRGSLTVQPTPAETATVAATATATPTDVPAPTATATPSPTYTPPPTSTGTPTSSHTPTPTNTATPTASPTFTATSTSTITPAATSTSTTTPTPTPTLVPGMYSTRYVAPNGSSNGTGTSQSPLDLATGLSRTAAGDTLILQDGIYRVDNSAVLYLGASSASQRTTIKADAGARPIVTRQNGDTPVVQIRDNTWVEGLWFGGNRVPAQQQSITLGNDGEIVGNTFFGFYGAINEGGNSRNKILNNRFVNTGGETYYHSIYINNMNTLPGEGALIEGNLFVGGEGYATHLWHDPKYVTIRGNFYGDVQWAIVIQGQNNVGERNIIWSTRGTAQYPLSVYLSDRSSYRFSQNVIGQRNNPPIIGSTDPRAVIDNNVFVGSAPRYGTNQQVWTVDEVPNHLGGLTAANLDSATSALRTAFTTSTDIIYADSSIEGYFNTLRTATQVWSAN